MLELECASSRESHYPLELDVFGTAVIILVGVSRLENNLIPPSLGLVGLGVF